jgi:endonuclease/exonuclease/phosphatase family metal-dependent hydrolase
VSFKLLSLNIERSKHLELVGSFVAAEKPDALCLQELMEKDIPVLERALGGTCAAYFPMARLSDEHPGEVYGLGILSTLRAQTTGKNHYVGPFAELPTSSPTDRSTFNNGQRAVLWCDFEKEGTTLRVATTHFTWTPNAAPDDAQRRDVQALLSALEPLSEFVLTGDFNAPRGGEIFANIAARFTDNVPARYTWSLDRNLHRAGTKLEKSARRIGLGGLMVDGVFSTPGFLVSDVEVHEGVSDHCAITATVTKAAP